ncbi:Site-specific DNA recombinase [Paenibacillus catalpae]|uniref:Site-specific DNA recombinase n=1 Tax=Paenibacillus catalpae TaxID=1045775 RepID=A0A1I1YKA1_9BACL|nr:recombinase family protein [Paenibacillus catalpae]SFE19957.1 Site-specific DNA recombinase [Paenibacillus catalpae]
MKIAYARVSTADQSLDLQMDSLKKFGYDRIYTEKASGGKDDRPELAKALEMLRDGDTLIVYKLDRLARSTLKLIETLDLLTKKGVEFISLSDNIDTSTSAGKAMFGMMAVFAEFERSIIRERTVAGLEAARARGRKGGRPMTDKKKLDKAIKLHESEEFTVTQIEEMTGVSKGSLYRELNRRKQGKIKAYETV